MELLKRTPSRGISTEDPTRGPLQGIRPRETPAIGPPPDYRPMGPIHESHPRGPTSLYTVLRIIPGDPIQRTTLCPVQGTIPRDTSRGSTACDHLQRPSPSAPQGALLRGTPTRIIKVNPKAHPLSGLLQGNTQGCTQRVSTQDYLNGTSNCNPKGSP